MKHKLTYFEKEGLQSFLNRYIHVKGQVYKLRWAGFVNFEYKQAYTFKEILIYFEKLVYKVWWPGIYTLMAKFIDIEGYFYKLWRAGSNTFNDRFIYFERQVYIR